MIEIDSPQAGNATIHVQNMKCSVFVARIGGRSLNEAAHVASLVRRGQPLLSTHRMNAGMPHQVFQPSR